MREGGREEEEERGERGRRGKGRRGRPQRDPPEAAESQARLRGPAFPAASFPCSWPAEQSGHLSFPCRFWSIVLLSLSLSLFLSLLSSLCHSLQLLRLMSFFDRILSVPACWFLPLCLNKCKHGEGSFKQAHTEDLFMWDPRRGGGGATATLLSCKPEMICKLRFVLSSSSWCHYEKTLP